MPVDAIRSLKHSRERSLGWLATRWIEYFCVHGPGDIQGTPMRGLDAIPLTTELTALTVDTYALDDDGRRLYDSVFFSRPKGADKSGHAARIALFEALGPCRFAGWAEGGEEFRWMDFRHVYKPGEAMGQAITYPFIRILATEEGQTGNVFDAVHYNLKEGPLSEAFTRADDVGLTRVYIPGGGEIRPSTASSSAKDGGKETHVNYDETHLYTSPELKRMYAVVRRNMAKRKDAEPWSFESSTMYEPGQNSVAEATHEQALRIKAGNVRRPRLLFDHRQAPPDVDLADEASLRAGIIEAYGDAASYMDIERIVSEVWDSRNDVQDSRRYFLNQVTAASDAWVTPQEWDRLARKHVVPSGAQITLGFDGSRTDDHTALIGCEVESGHLFTLDIWDPAMHGGEIPTEQVDGTVRRAFANYDVVAFYSDYYPWESYVDAWARDFGQSLAVKRGTKNPLVWDMRGNKRETTEAVEAFHATIVDGALTHDDDVRLTQHVHNARRWPNQYGVTMGKESRESSRKMDGAMAAMLARKAWQDYESLPDNKKRRKRTGRAMFAG